MTTDRQWVQSHPGLSWHIVLTRAIEGWRTLCGRLVFNADSFDERPAGKSCELCLRAASRQDDQRSPDYGDEEP